MKKATPRLRAVISGAVGGVALIAICTSCSSSEGNTASLNATWAQSIGAYGVGPGQFASPLSVAANTKTVVITDEPTSRVQTFSPTGTFAKGWGDFGTGAGQMWVPQGVAVRTTCCIQRAWQ